jgi:hypothetical protein
MGPGENPRQPESAESSKTYPGAIWLGPWIIAVNSPADRTQRTGPMKADSCQPEGAVNTWYLPDRDLARQASVRCNGRPADQGEIAMSEPREVEGLVLRLHRKMPKSTSAPGERL